MKYKYRYAVFGVTLVIYLLTLYYQLGNFLIFLRNWWAGDMIDFTGFSNTTGATYYIIPDVVHYIRLQEPNVTYVQMLCLLSLLKNHRPQKIIIHTDVELQGKYWENLRRNYTIELNYYEAPRYVFGSPLSSPYHSTDIARIEILMKYGGIYLDSDVFVVQSLDKFRKFEMVIGWPEDEAFGTQVLIAHKNARFLRSWLNTYEQYKPRLWYYNAAELPTSHVLQLRPELVHRVKVKLGVGNLVSQLFSTLWSEWTEYYTIHLLYRHRKYLTPDDYEDIPDFNENNIKNYTNTFGEMARSIL